MHRLIGLAVAIVALSGCDKGNSKFAEYSDYELSERYGQCLAKKPTAPGKAVACENVRKECERRRNEKGYSVCPTPN